MGHPGVHVWLPPAITTTAPLIDHLFYGILVLTGVVFVGVQATLVYFLIRYRHRPEHAAHYTHGNTLIEVIWTVIPALFLVALAVNNQQVWAKVRGTPPKPDVEIEITAEQFAWNIRYAGADGVLNTADDIMTINQMHVPLQKNILFHIKSKDVIHSFFVPQFRLKQDAVPGFTGHLWVSATTPGNFEIACAELCGLGHYRMRGFLTVEPQESFEAWLQQALQEQSA